MLSLAEDSRCWARAKEVRAVRGDSRGEVVDMVGIGMPPGPRRVSPGSFRGNPISEGSSLLSETEVASVGKDEIERESLEFDNV